MCSKEDTHKFLLSNLANKDETKKGKTEPEMFLEVLTSLQTYTHCLHKVRGGCQLEERNTKWLTWPPVCLF